MRFHISVIILTHNEEHNIADCISELNWADEVIVVDSGSNDRTIDLARTTRPDVRIFEHAFEDFGQQRNWALSETEPKHEWVLFLDADERCTSRCAVAIRTAIARAHNTVGFYLCPRNIFLGRPIKRCSFFPSWQLRVLKLGHVTFRKEGHGQKEVTEGPLGYIDEPYDHYGFSSGVSHWIARHNEYSSNEVELIHRLRAEPLRLWEILARHPLRRRACMKRLAAKIGFRPILRFVYTYFLRLGFLDGRAGLVFCLLRMAHECHITAKLAEIRWTEDEGHLQKSAQDSDRA